MMSPPVGRLGRTVTILGSRWSAGLVVVSGLATGLVLLAPMPSLWLVVLVGIGGPLLWLLWQRPEIGIIALSLLTMALVPRAMTTTSLGGVRLDVADVVMLALLVVYLGRGLAERRLFVPGWAFMGPLIGFGACAVFSALYARLYHDVELGLIVGELRPAAYCVACALVTTMVVRRGHLGLLVVGLFLVADLTAGVVVLQQFWQDQASLATTPALGVWQVSAVEGAAGGFGGVRVVPPGHVLVYLMANIAFCLLLDPRMTTWVRTALILQLGLLGLGLLLTYTRAQWIASLIAMGLATIVLPKPAQAIVGRAVVGLGLLAGLALAVVSLSGDGLGGSGAGQALLARASSIVTPDETLDTASLEWRRFEIEAVVDALGHSPWLGVGLGNDYRAVTLLQGEASGWLWDLDSGTRLTRFVHNSYLYIAVKMGLIALLVFLWTCLALLISGSLRYRRLPGGLIKPLALASICSLIGLLEWSLFIANFMLPASMATLGLMIGLVAGPTPARWPATQPAPEPRGTWSAPATGAVVER